MNVNSNHCSEFFCQCDTIKAVTIEQDEWKVWYVCTACGKPIKWSERYYHYYDGEARLEDDKMGLEGLLKRWTKQKCESNARQRAKVALCNVY